MNTVSKLSLICMAGCLAGCPSAPRNQVENDQTYITIAGTKFRKTAAFQADILWVGNKKASRFEPLFLPVLAHDVPAHLSTEAFSEESRKAAFEAGGKVDNPAGNAEITGGHTSEQNSKGTYKIFVIRNIADLIEELNSEGNRSHIEKLKYYPEPRIVIGTAVVFSQESSIKNINEGKVNLAVSKLALKPEVRFSGSQNTNSTVKLSDGTIFAYDLARMCFTESNGRIIIATLDSDKPDVGDTACPTNTYRSIIALEAEKASGKARITNK